ncbi:transporter [Pseudactinotalea sp. HY160]|uniref:transporter n=1 Tax=Pseudactinotalea sp. HY160 TaxID=2654490 RepID=UPI00128E82D1|nr:transporter [Pseudactinotalea sp. HY160]MPV48992.1 transporter [Pseudactinotalea sp. HY160]
MVATLLQLRARMLVNSLKRETWRLVLTLLGVAYGLGVVALLAVAAFLLRDAAPESKALGVLAGGIVLTAGAAIVPLLAFGVDDSLDPARFALFTTASTRLAVGLALAGAISLPAIFIGLGSLVVTILWSTSILTAVAWLVSGAIGLATCLLLARVTTTAAATWLRSRRGRDALAVISLVVFFTVVLVPTLGDRLDWGGAVRALEPAAGILAWSPFGAAWAVTGAIATGSVGTALAHLVVALAWAGLLLWAWRRLLGPAMVARAEAAAHRRRSMTGGYTLPERLSDTFRLPPPAAAVAARCLRYWRSDPRYVSIAVGSMFIPVMIVFLAEVGQAGDVAVMAPILFALFAAWSVHDDTAHDSTALWMHVSAGISGVHDRMGRAIAALAWLVPAGIALTVTACALTGRWESLPAVLGATLGILLAGLAVSMCASGLLVYPAQPPGASPFSTNGMGSVGLTLLAQTVTGIATLALSLPVIVTTLLGFFVAPGWGWVTLALGIGGGIGTLAAGVRLGGRFLDARGARHLQVIRGWAGH